MPTRLLVELPPVVFRAAGSGDVVARRILDQLGDEVVSMAVAAIRRLRLLRSDVDVVLGGGMFRADDPVFFERIRSGIQASASRSNVATLRTPPLLGAALMGLDEIGATPRTEARVRGTIDAAMAAAERTRPRSGAVHSRRSSNGV